MGKWILKEFFSKISFFFQVNRWLDGSVFNILDTRWNQWALVLKSFYFIFSGPIFNGLIQTRKWQEHRNFHWFHISCRVLSCRLEQCSKPSVWFDLNQLMGLNLISANISMMLIGEKCQTFFSEIVFYVWGHWQFTVWLFLSSFICWILYLAFNAIALLGLAFRCLV